MRRGILPRCSREPTCADKQIQLDKTTAGDVRRVEARSERRKPNRDGWVAPTGRTRYFLLQPSLPLTQATWLGACSVLIALARPAFLLRAPLANQSYTRSGSRTRTIASAMTLSRGKWQQ